MKFSITHIPPLQKAAILVAALDHRAADQLLDQMPESLARQVRDQVLQLTDVDPELQQEILQEFLRQQQPVTDSIDSTADGTVEYVHEAHQSRANTYAPTWQASAPAPVASTSSLQFLTELSPDVVSTTLQRESPQMIALVLAHLPARHAAALLEQFTSEQQADIARRIIELDETDPQIVEELAHSLNNTLQEELRRERRRNSGMNRLAGILAAAPEQAEQRILSNLQQFQITVTKTASPPAAASRATIPLTQTATLQFQQLHELHDQQLLQLLQSLDTDVVVLALAGAEPELVNRISTRLPKAQAKLLQRALHDLGPTRISDVEQAQQQIMQQAQQLGLFSTQRTTRLQAA
jgi:flagellar motor switch protein FliG